MRSMFRHFAIGFETPLFKVQWVSAQLHRALSERFLNGGGGGIWPTVHRRRSGELMEREGPQDNTQLLDALVQVQYKLCVGL